MIRISCHSIYLTVLLFFGFASSGCNFRPNPEQEVISPVVQPLELPKSDSLQPVKILFTGDYSEGVVVDRDGNIYFSHGKVITMVTSDGGHRVWAETGAPNGHKILADGTHLVCDASHHAVLRLDSKGNMMEPASQECDGKALRAPNDISVDVDGGFYFTDPGGSDASNPIGTIHYVGPSGKTYLVAGGLAFPNGIVLLPNQQSLLVAESKKNRILLYEVLSPGRVGPMKIFADLPSKAGEQIGNEPDGMCLDVDGNLYVAHNGMRQIQVLDPSGRLIRRYSGGNLTTSNCAFGGPKLDQLFVTGGHPGALFRLDLGVAGLDIRPKKQQPGAPG